jgi:hypothetical protein
MAELLSSSILKAQTRLRTPEASPPQETHLMQPEVNLDVCLNVDGLAVKRSSLENLHPLLTTSSALSSSP